MLEASRDEPVSFANVVDAEGRRIARHHRLLGIADKERWGLALSGGGIRSATFCLGVVEWLIQKRRIHNFDYLSTVSGGGYIGSWLVGMLHRQNIRDQHDSLRREALRKHDAVVHHHEVQETDEVTYQRDRAGNEDVTHRYERLEHEDVTHSSGEGGTEKTRDRIPKRDEPIERWRLEASILYLRRYSNYLTPSPGLLRPDTLAAVLTYLRNLLLNAFLLVPVFAALLLLPALLSGAAMEVAIPFAKSFRTPLVEEVNSLNQIGLPEHFMANPTLFALILAFFFVLVVLAGLAGPRPADDPPWYLQEHVLKPVMAVLGFLPALLLAQFLVLARHVHPAYVIWSGVVIVTFSVAIIYFLFSSIALLAWWLAGRTKKEWNLDDRTGKGTRMGLLAYCGGSIAAGAVGGFLLALTYHYLAGWLAGVVPLALDDSGVASPFSNLLYQVKQAGGLHLLTSILLLPALCFIGFVTVSIHVATCRRVLTEHDREWGSRWMAYIAWLVALWLAACVLAFVVPPLFAWLGSPAAAGAATWLGASGLTAYFARALGQAGQGLADKAAHKAKGVVLAIGPYIFVIGALCALSLLNHTVLDWLWDKCPRLWYAPGTFFESLDTPRSFAHVLGRSLEIWNVSLMTLVELTAGSVFLAFLAGFAVDANLFSLQNFYRNRLTRCYLGASKFANGSRDECERWRAKGERRPHPPTDLNPDDDLRLARLSMVRPYPIINTALNLNVATELAWQQRKAASFVFSPLYCGYQIPLCHDHRTLTGTMAARAKLWDLAAGGFRPTFRYLFADDRGAKLGLPIAISGAAFTSNAGFRTKPWMTFLLTVFGIRLGRWCSNTGTMRSRFRSPLLKEAWQRPAPWNSLGLLLGEVLGLTTEKRKFVYLSDGGHFENLGIYELIRRRSELIVAIDATADPENNFDDLANAVRKCRIDFGVEITFDNEAFHKLSSDGNRLCMKHVIEGQIRYPEDGATGKRQKGRLFYVKASLTGDEPTDVASYRAQHQEFPHETTLDQWFDETQFESYRQLGLHIATSELAQLLPEREHTLFRKINPITSALSDPTSTSLGHIL